MRKGRLQRRGHDDGPRRRAPAKACALLRLTELEQRAKGDVGSCWGVGGAIAVAEEQRGRAAVGNGAGGSGAGMAAAAGEEEGRGNEKWSVEGVGRTLAVMKARPGASWPARTERWRRVAVAGDTRRAGSAGVGH